MLIPFCVSAQVGKPYIHYSTVVEKGDTLTQMNLSAIFVFQNNRKGKMLAKRYKRMVNAIRVTYPIAKAAQRELEEMERKITTMSKKEQKSYTKGVEDRLKVEYTPILKKMSMYQGVILLKLIDRQTGDTSYSLVQELRGKVSALFWQGVARIFGTNLKTEYNVEEDDKLLEELVDMYEKGLI